MKKSDKAKEIIIYTDGSCLRNPGAGGYGVVLLYEDRREELQGGYRRTTNNRMEIMAAIKGLQALTNDGSIVRVYSDSRYLVNSMSKRWAHSWQRKGWKKRYGKPCANIDLWAELLILCKRHKVTFEWIRGHSGNVENRRCDSLAYAACKQGNLAIDEGYVASKSPNSRLSNLTFP
jgi:ribonuclease HI